MVTLLLLACSTPASPPRFVRDGVVRGGHFAKQEWHPGDVIDGVTAPKRPECAPLWSVELEDMRRLAAVGAPEPAAALAFSPDGRWLAIGSDGGSLRVVDADTGAPRARRQLAEGAVKQVAWAADSGTLYVGEQSPDANVYAMDPSTLDARWTLRLADRVGTSPVPTADDAFGLYSLPAAYMLQVLGDGSLLLSAAHGWSTDEGRKNRSQLVHVGADGGVLGAWPATPADAVLLHVAVDGDTALVPLSRSADGPAPTDLPIGGVAAVELTSMTAAWTKTFPVLPPFTGVFVWDAVGLGPEGGFVGLGDGRAFLFGRDGAERAVLTPGVPVRAQGVPIAAGVGFGALSGGTLFLATTETNIPYGAADPSARPPAAHPAEFTLHAVTPDGTPRWSRQLDAHLAGVVPSPDGTTLLVGAGPRTTDERTDLYGAVLLDPADGTTRTTCPTEGPVDFRPVWAPDSRRLAVAEAPFKVQGEVRGAYRVTVFR